MPSRIVFFGFDLFGSGGSAAGVEMLAEALDEILADHRRETVPTRADAYARALRVRQVAFEKVDDYRTWRARGRRAFRQALAAGDFVVWVTGNHLGVLPAYDELAALDDPGLVVQFDAHLDVQHFAELSPEPSHANFLLHCAGPLPPLVNVGHRDLLLPPEHWGKYYRAAYPAAELARDPEGSWRAIEGRCRAASRLWVDLDWDVLDPAFFPAVSRPVPFGLAPLQLLGLLERLWSPKVAGVFLSEFDPGHDRQDQGLATAAWLLEHILLRCHEGPADPPLPRGRRRGQS